MNAAVLLGIGVALIVLGLLLRWKWKSKVPPCDCLPPQAPTAVASATVHRLCPHNNVVQCFEVEQKDSLDDHLDVLTRKLAEKEGRLRLSKSRIQETQHEIDNLHAIDQNVRYKYREVMDSLKKDLLCNEKDCRKLQEQIEWVSRRRAELKDEVQRKEAAILQEAITVDKLKVRHGQRQYAEAAAELATNLAELQRGRNDYLITEKPHDHAFYPLRHRKEPQLPRCNGCFPHISKWTNDSSPPSSKHHIHE